MNDSEIKIFIVEDHAMFREGLRYILNTVQHFSVIGEADNGRDFLNKIETVIPDVVLMDIDMPEMNGIDATRLALEKYPDIKILSLSMHGDYGHYLKMIEAGAKGFVLKSAGINQLTQAITETFNGKPYFSQELLINIIQSKDASINESYVISKLEISEREQEVLHLICKGYSNKEIADKLFISIKTVEGHKSKLLLKTDSKNSISLVLFALKSNLFNV